MTIRTSKGSNLARSSWIRLTRRMTTPYADFEDYRARALLEVNAILLTEDALVGRSDHPESMLRVQQPALGSLGSTAIPRWNGWRRRLVTWSGWRLPRWCAWGGTSTAVLEEALNYPVSVSQPRSRSR